MKEDITILKIGGSSITNKAEEETLNQEALDWFAKLVAASIDPSFLSTECQVEKVNEGASTKCKSQFIIVHGAGSFGHHSAKRYGIRCGKRAYLEDVNNPHHPESTRRRSIDARHVAYEPNIGPTPEHPNESVPTPDDIMKQRYQMEGLAKTRQSVQKLNAATVNTLIKHGVNAVGISPGMSIHSLRAHGATGLPKRSYVNEYTHDASPRGMQDLCEAIKQALRAGLVPVVHGDACLVR